MNQLSEKQLSFDCAMKIVNKQKWIQIKDIERLEKFIQNQQATITKLQEENEQLKNELRKEKSLREYSDSMYGADLIVNIRFSNGEWKADVSVIDDE